VQQLYTPKALCDSPATCICEWQGCCIVEVAMCALRSRYIILVEQLPLLPK
jgi:hypothetical protein